MATASAKVIIDAEDLASKKMADAARNVERSVKNIKDVGGKAKASTEFIGTLANTLKLQCHSDHHPHRSLQPTVEFPTWKPPLSSQRPPVPSVTAIVRGNPSAIE